MERTERWDLYRPARSIAKSRAMLAWGEPSTATAIRLNSGGAIGGARVPAYISVAYPPRRGAPSSSDPSLFPRSVLTLGDGDLVPPVCSNCGASDFVWANELKTGSIGGGSLSLRARGELSMGTRLCRSCGHADLFLKDPSILKMPHTWKPGEFVPIPSRPVPTSPPSAPQPHPAGHGQVSAPSSPVPA